jgi:CheY-like chemotaxis protein
MLTDTGIGIPENRLEHIFNNFEQAHRGISSSYGGTGLGLAIAKQLVELQGGTINVISEVSKGSAFSFVLNFGKTNSKEKSDNYRMEKGKELTPVQNNSKPATVNNNIKVLVVEDVTLNQLLLKIILVEFGFGIDIANNGKIAIEKLQKNVYDIILMDLQMPEMNGFEATAYIRNEMNSQIPIIALTADVTTVDVEKCKAVGMNDYISKPIDEKLLYSKISKYLKIPGHN